MSSNHQTTNRLVIKVFVFVVLAVGGLLLLRPLITGQGKEQAPARQATDFDRKSSANVSTSEARDRINSLVDEGESATGRWGICVVSMADGSVVFARNSEKLFTPASNMKIYTTAVALDLLGANYRWRTSVYSDVQPDANGTVAGDLILYGRGAPDLIAKGKDEDSGSLATLADDLYARGLRSVRGNVVGDESYFRGDPLGDGWQWNDLQWYFGAEASALSINGNEIDVNLVPSGKAGEPPTVRTSDTENYMTVANRMATAGSVTRTTIGVHRGLSDNNLQVWGEFAPGTKGFGVRLSVHQPALWAAKLLVAALKARGIKVEGQTVSRGSRVPVAERFDPAKAVELAFVESQPFSAIARKTNKESNNLYAELILRTLGRERGEMAALPASTGRERGDDEAGLAVIRVWLTRAGIDASHLALHDGSGLSRLDLVTPEASARLLVAMARTSAGQVFKESLPVAGQDGTLAGRLKPLTKSVYAKTGSLIYDNSLSGYLTTSKGELLAFSIMSNDQTARGDATRLIDQIVTLLAGLPAQEVAKTQK